jgi:hypothetical protein
MDADDVSYRERLDRQVAVLESDGRIALVGASAETIDGNGRHVGWRYTGHSEWPIERRLLWRNQFIHPTVAFRREAILSVGGYDERVVRLEDWELWLRLVGRATLVNLPEPLLQYRLHAGQHSRSRWFSHGELAVLNNSRSDAALRIGRSRTYASGQHFAWVAYQRAMFLRQRLKRA